MRDIQDELEVERLAIMSCILFAGGSRTVKQAVSQAVELHRASVRFMIDEDHREALLENQRRSELVDQDT